MTPPALTRPAGRSLLRRYAADLGIVAATLAFVAGVGLIGLWLLLGR